MTPLNVASEFRLYLANRWLPVVPFHFVRLFFYRHMMRVEIGPGSTLFMDCQLDCAGGLVIGKNSVVNQGCRLDARGGIRIGDNVSISAKVTILTADHDPQSPQFAGRTAPVTIEDRAFVGTGAMILKGVRIGAAAIVGAGSIVTRDVPAGEIWAGNPARKIGLRQTKAFDYTNNYKRLFQ